MSYGLLHAIAQPVYSWGVTRSVKFPGLNMDIGGIRNLSWAKDNNDKTWIAYNRLRGQYMSALEHAIPERFFNDPAKCNAEGTTTPVAGLPACPQGISAVKAIALAAAQGQKIYTITQNIYRANPNIVSTNLSNLSSSTRQGIQNALDAGNEVTAHEAPITQSGWTGAGYTFTDPNTGAGGYIIDGGSNGGSLQVDGDLAGFILNVLSKTASIAGNALQKVLGTFMSLMLNLLDAGDIYEKCTGSDAIVRPLAFLVMAIGLSTLFGLGLANAPFILILIAVVLLTLVVNAMKDAFLRCR